jgi:hypothetical protein
MRIHAHTPSTARNLAIAIISLGTLSAASAAEPQRGALAACGTDLATFCPGSEAGGGRKMRCLMDNRAKLSPACATSVDARLSQRAARLGGTDVAQATPGTTPGTAPGATPPPAASPATPIQAATPAARPIRASMRACRTDTATFCASVEKGGGRKVKCLIENQAKLSPDCAAAINRRADTQDKRAAVPKQ